MHYRRLYAHFHPSGHLTELLIGIHLSNLVDLTHLNGHSHGTFSFTHLDMLGLQFIPNSQLFSSGSIGQHYSNESNQSYPGMHYTANSLALQI